MSPPSCTSQRLLPALPPSPASCKQPGRELCAFSVSPPRRTTSRTRRPRAQRGVLRAPHSALESLGNAGGGGRGALGALHLEAMQPLRAHVHNGRLVLDEPTDLPEGEVVELVPADAAAAEGLDAEERAALHRELEASVLEMKSGLLIAADDVLAELRAMR